MIENIIVKGACENNLKNLSVEMPRNKLVVMTGVSGSGKSTLAFGTIFAEGQRRFMESLSSYARQFLGSFQKPAVDSIEGLSPCIAINQKTTNHNPRSTVGTVTEIYDYLRLLYARIGDIYCPKCGKKITRQSIDQIVAQALGAFNDKVVSIEAPVVRGHKGAYQKEIEAWRRSGYSRVKIDGSVYGLDENIELDKNLRHDIRVVVDRIRMNENESTRITDSIETAVHLTDGLVMIVCGDEERIFSNKFSCIDCGISIEDLEPRHFSFNSPFGACDNCSGLGFTFEIDEKLIDEAKISAWWSFGESSYFKNRTKQEIIDDLKRRFRDTTSDYVRTEIGKLMTKAVCPVCGGRRLKQEYLSIRVGGINIYELTSKSISDTLAFFEGLKLSPTQEATARLIIREITARLSFLVNVGLHYLTLARSADSLSGGESQRIRLATQIGSGLVGVLYILDEPSIGLHQHDNNKLIETLKKLRDLGNTLIVVEHDEDTIRAADYIVDIGAKAGINGGELVVAGTLSQVIACEKSITGQFLGGTRSIEIPKEWRKGNGHFVEIVGAHENNLKKVDVKFPLGKFIAVTGVSGSGKSSLVNKILYPALYNAISRGSRGQGKYEAIIGAEHLEKVIDIDQSPIGRTPRSNPATYIEVFTAIRDLFAATRDARERGYTSGRFSFNVRGGRCDNCDGDGIRRIEMHFLPDVFVPCEVCGGKRFNHETLEVRFKDKNIYEVLEMTVDEAVKFFENVPAVYKKLKTLQDVGLGYIHLGQSATSLSGGEAQRVKLAKELSRSSAGKTMYILDEPTTGLHSYDVQKLVNILQRLVDAGNTVIVIEHNLDVIKVCDHIIDLGPTGGDLGGHIITTGSPRDVANDKGSLTGEYLKRYF
jgi:excinuclease ABC subunit A